MGKISKDTLDLLVGRDGSEKESDDFKTELQRAIKKGQITKTEGTLLMTSRTNVDKFGDKIEKDQINYLKRIKDGELFNSQEEELDAERRKKEKEEEEKRKREERLAEFNKQLKEKEKRNKDNQKSLEKFLDERNDKI